MNARLTHHVKMYKWPKVKKVIQEFKKKKHKEFYLDIHEIEVGIF